MTLLIIGGRVINLYGCLLFRRIEAEGRRCVFAEESVCRGKRMKQSLKRSVVDDRTGVSRSGLEEVQNCHQH